MAKIMNVCDIGVHGALSGHDFAWSPSPRFYRGLSPYVPLGPKNDE